MKEVEFPRGWLKEQCDRIEAKAALVPCLEARVAELEAQLKDLAENEDPIGCIVRLQAELAERDAEIVRMNKIWDDAVDYGARVRGALVETRKALVTAKDFLWRNISTDKAVEIRGVADVVLAKYKSLAGED